MARLTLANHNVHSTFSAFASGSGTNAEVTVNNGSSWMDQGRMVIGKNGSATLNIRDAVTVTSSETQIGAEMSGVGVVNVSQMDPFKGTPAQWTTGSIAVGLNGTGTVNHLGGTIESNSVSIAFESGSEGHATVDGSSVNAAWNFDGSLEVGEGGIGDLMVLGGAIVMSSSSGDVIVGRHDTSFGTIRVNGAQSKLMASDGNVFVALDGSGDFSVENGATVTCNTGQVGSNGSGEGLVVLDNSTWTSSGGFFIGEAADSNGGGGSLKLLDGTLYAASLNVYYNGLISGAGVIISPNSLITGTASPGILITPPKTSVPQDDGIGTLTFGGDLTFGGATIVISATGTGTGEHDIIEVTGTADIQSATVHFVFQDGFLPQTDDEIPFFMAQGGLTVGTLAFTYEGAAPGFQYEVMEEGGMLMFNALNDAQPLGGEPTPRPTAINPNTDINGDNIVDVNDLLEVMRNWYHVVPE